MSSDYRNAGELDGNAATGVKATSLVQKLKDVWWRICTSEGSIWNMPILVWGANGYPEKDKSTPALELGYNKLNNAVLRGKLDTILANQKSLDDKLNKIILKLGA